MCLPDKPGLGIEIDEAKVREAAQIGHNWKNQFGAGKMAQWQRW